MSTVRLTTAQALVRAMQAQFVEIDGEEQPMFAGVWAIFGHGNVAGLGEALYGARDSLPTLRAHNEQAMVHAAIAFAKTARRKRMMACTTSIGPGALNMVTAAAVAHVNRLPVLLLPGDVFADRKPDPVLQQIEDFGDGTVSANDCFRPVSRYFDRLTRPEQLVQAFQRAIAVLTDPAECGPVTLALCQDVQAQAWDFPQSLFERRVHRPRRTRPDLGELGVAIAALRGARRPLAVAGGGVLYSGAEQRLADFCAAHGVPVAETQAGKSAIADDHALNLGAIGVTGTEAANDAAREADVVLAVGTRLQDFTSGSNALFAADATIIGLNTQAFDAAKHGALPLVGDARTGLDEVAAGLGGWTADPGWTARVQGARISWRRFADGVLDAAPSEGTRPTDAQVVGAVLRGAAASDIVVCAAGGLPGELHKLWRAGQPGGYHLEYGFSCMGYEIAGGLGAKMAAPEREVIVMVGDGSYMMMNSELATACAFGLRLIVVLLDNHGYGCIDRLQRSTGCPSFNNLWQAAPSYVNPPAIDFAAHAAAQGAHAVKVGDLGALSEAIAAARDREGPSVVVIDTDPAHTTGAGGAWWDVAVPELSELDAVRAARSRYLAARAAQV